jgi:hypothetical protein
MQVLKMTFGSSPFFILGSILLVAGFANVLYRLFKVDRSGKKRKEGNVDQNWLAKNSFKLSVFAIIAILTAMIFFISWLSKLKM